MTVEVLIVIRILFFFLLSSRACKSQPCTQDSPPKLRGRLLCVLPDSRVVLINNYLGISILVMLILILRSWRNKGIFGDVY